MIPDVGAHPRPAPGAPVFDRLTATLWLCQGSFAGDHTDGLDVPSRLQAGVPGAVSKCAPDVVEHKFAAAPGGGRAPLAVAEVTLNTPN